MSEPVSSEAYRGASPVDDSDPERKWLREVYQGDGARQLTVRAVVAGMLLGGVMSLSNLYIALKTGWSFGVTITAGILAYLIFNLLKSIGLARKEFGMLENNAMQSVASAAGYMTGGGTVAAIPALMRVLERPISGWTIFFWITPIAMLGVFMAIPMKRQMINQEGLKFPSGIAAAETLRGLHPEEAAAMDARRSDKPGTAVDSEGAKLAGRALLWSALVGALVLWLREARARWMLVNLPKDFHFPFKIRGTEAAQWSVLFDTSLLLIAAGAIMGWRSAWSMMLGGAINFFALGPHGFDIHEIRAVAPAAITRWTVWFGSPLLLTSGLLSFAFSWRQIARAFSGLSGLFSKAKPVEEDPLAAVEVPMHWFVYGVAGLTPVVMFFAWRLFHIAWWMSLLCIVMSFFIAIVACRATGETDTTPTGALGKITQLVFGVVAPGSITTNLMCASMSGGVAIHSADMLTDLKSGHLLGAKPRQQFVAQFFGVIAGSMFVVPAFRLLVPNHTVIGSRDVPAPAALAWETVSRALAQGVHTLPPGARQLILIGAVLGVVMVLIEKALPPKFRRFFPSPVGFGLAFTMPFSNTLSMFVGAVIALAFEYAKPKEAERYLVPVSSGIIAGESLIGILIKVLQRVGALTAG